MLHVEMGHRGPVNEVWRSPQGVGARSRHGRALASTYRPGCPTGRGVVSPAGKPRCMCTTWLDQCVAREGDAGDPAGAPPRQPTRGRRSSGDGGHAPPPPAAVTRDGGRRGRAHYVVPQSIGRRARRPTEKLMPVVCASPRTGEYGGRDFVVEGDSTKPDRERELKRARDDESRCPPRVVLVTSCLRAQRRVVLGPVRAVRCRGRDEAARLDRR